jgi:hypothetical protein
MRRFGILLLATGVLLSLICLSIGATVDAAKPVKSPPSCKNCHAELSAVLPKGHPAVSGADIAACAPCHAPDYSGKARSNAYAARLHRAHEKSGKQVDCTVCHAWIPGKRFAVLGQKKSLGAPSKEDMALLKKMFVSWGESSNLDAIHAKKDIDCMGCHGESLPKEGDTVENDRCLLCHGPLDKLEAKTAPKDFPDRNPHKSHLGEIACTVCHHAHSASRVYCLECHKTFKMKLPEEGK